LKNIICPFEEYIQLLKRSWKHRNNNKSMD